MKFKIFIIVVINLILFGCSEDFLNLAPLSNVNKENFYKTSEDIEVALTGVYGTLHSSTLTTLPEYRGGNAWLSHVDNPGDLFRGLLCLCPLFCLVL